jgi:DNA polymerase III subunit delta
VPPLKLGDLEKQIASGRLAPIYLFVGNDVKLIDRQVDAIEATVDLADRPFAVERVYAGEPGGLPLEIAASARVFPMLGDRRIVIVLRAERLLKPKRAVRGTDEAEETADQSSGEPADVGPIEDYLADPSPSTTLVFVATDVDRTRRLTKRLVDKAATVTFSGLEVGRPADRRDLRATAGDLLRKEVEAAGRTIEQDAVRLLVDRAGSDITKLRGDIERLLLFAEGRRRITLDDALEVASSDAGTDDAWAVVNAIAAGDAGRAVREARRRLERGESPHGLVGQLRWWVSNRLAEADPVRVKPALVALLRTDQALKSSGGDERVLVERLVVELTGRPVERQGFRGR